MRIHGTIILLEVGNDFVVIPVKIFIILSMFLVNFTNLYHAGTLPVIFSTGISSLHQLHLRIVCLLVILSQVWPQFSHTTYTPVLVYLGLILIIASSLAVPSGRISMPSWPNHSIMHSSHSVQLRWTSHNFCSPPHLQNNVRFCIFPSLSVPLSFSKFFSYSQHSFFHLFIFVEPGLLVLFFHFLHDL